MEAKDKAKELVEKYNLIVCYDTYQAKQCAIIAVDEIIDNNVFPCVSESDLICNDDYWQEVKNEIEKL